MRKYWAEILMVIFFILFFTMLIRHYGAEEQMDEISEMPVPELKFGFPVDSFHIVEGRISPNQNLGDLLTGYGVSMASIDQLARNSAEIFDVRKIRSGNNFYIFQSLDSSRTARYMVYENNKVDYVIFSLDSLNTFTGKREVEVEQKTAVGIIETSLWNAMIKNGLNPVLANELSEIYAWTIDFFGIQKGDRFRVLYEEQFVDEQSVGIGPVHAVQFDHMGKSFYAFRFFQDERFDYFDDQGQSLRKAFLKAPLKFSARVTSHFSHSRFHPILKIRRPHHGVDYAAPAGTPVVSIGDGVVEERAYQSGGAGNYLRIKHNSVYTTVYMHLRGFGPGIAKGKRVQQGQVIGYVGSTGLSTGAHLDFRVFKNGSPVDPLRVEAPPTEPVKPENVALYHVQRDSLMMHLNQVGWSDEMYTKGQ